MTWCCRMLRMPSGSLFHWTYQTLAGRTSQHHLRWSRNGTHAASTCIHILNHTRYRALGPELIPVYRQSAHRWLYAIHLAVGCHYFPCGYLPSRRASPLIGQYQIILFGDRGTCMWAACQRLLRVSRSAEIWTCDQTNAPKLRHTGHLVFVNNTKLSNWYHLKNYNVIFLVSQVLHSYIFCACNHALMIKTRALTEQWAVKLSWNFF